MSVLFIQKYYLLVLLRLQALHKFSKGVGSWKILLIPQISSELHSLHQIAHPLLAKVAVGKAILDKFFFKLKTDKKTILFAIATNIVYIFDWNGSFYSLEMRVIVDIQSIDSNLEECLWAHATEKFVDLS